RMEAQAYRVRTLGEWEQGWKEGAIVVQHCSFFLCNRMLESYIDKVLCERKGVRLQIWDTQQFFEDQKLIYSEEVVPAIPGAKVYKLSLYRCDQYKFSIHRGSLVAINPRDKEKVRPPLIMSSNCGKVVSQYSFDLICIPGRSCDIEFIQSSGALSGVKDKEWGLDVFIGRQGEMSERNSALKMIVRILDVL
uniref:Uncharacterized protein n=1 Tax=Oncorhynchus tshawytscha TaxID=74940 RepID=A0A8C8H9D4_ONCTS